MEQNGKEHIGGAMIPKEAFWSIAAVMGVFWIFGVVCDRLIIKWTESRTEPEENPDHERWEEDPEPSIKKSCANCRHVETAWRADPCTKCTMTYSEWEERSE